MEILSPLNSTYTLILLVVLVFAFIALATYYGLFYIRVGVFASKKKEPTEPADDTILPSVSVVLTSHNEAAYLKESLVYLLEQNYPKYEVVVVNHTSSDDTKFVLQVCKENYPHLKYITLDTDVNMFQGNTYPLSIGIKSAKNDIILLTQPNCTPVGFDWIRNMVSSYLHGSDIVIGNCTVKQEKGLLNALMQYDNLTTTANCFGWAMLGNPYTGMGSNISYRRNFFFDRGAFIRYYGVSNGAADLFVNQNANKRNSTIVLNNDAYEQRMPQPNFHQWHLHRKSQYSTRKHFGSKDSLLLFAHPFMVILLYLSAILFGISDPKHWVIPAAIIFIDWLWQSISFSIFSKRLDNKHICCHAPLFEIYFVFANTFLYLITLHKEKNRWR